MPDARIPAWLAHWSHNGQAGGNLAAGAEPHDQSHTRASDKASELSTVPAIPELTLPAYVLGQACQRAGKLALVDAATGAALTYAELAAEVARVSTGLLARGMTTGDVLALCTPNSIEFVLTYLAAASAGAVVTTVNPMWKGPEISRQLRQTGARGW
jgi:non-ribosomal peptide synthetase component E (peptide arylation enzyme)